MASHPQFPIQTPLVQHNPLVNMMHDIYGRNKTVQEVLNDRLPFQEVQRKTKRRRNTKKD